MSGFGLEEWEWDGSEEPAPVIPITRPAEPGGTLRAASYRVCVAPETWMRWTMEARNDDRLDVGEWACELALENAELAQLSASVPSDSLRTTAETTRARLSPQDEEGRTRNVLINDVGLDPQLWAAARLGLFQIVSWRRRARVWLLGDQRPVVPGRSPGGGNACSGVTSRANYERMGREQAIWTVDLNEQQAAFVGALADNSYAGNLTNGNAPPRKSGDEKVAEFVVEHAEARLLYLQQEPWMRRAIVHNQDMDSLRIVVQSLGDLVLRYTDYADEAEKPLLATQIEEAAELVALIGQIRFCAMPSEEILRAAGAEPWKLEEQS